MSNNEHSHIQQQVLERIHSGNVKMKPKLFFILKALLVLVVALLVLLVSALLTSFIFFGLRITGHESLLEFGPRGIFLFLEIFPWPLLFADILLLILLEWLLRRFRFAYKRPLLYIFLALAVLAGASGFIFDSRTHFHDDRFREGRGGKLPPPLKGVYGGARPNAPEGLGVYRGYVISVEETTFSLSRDDGDSDGDDGVRTIVLPPPHFRIDLLTEGDHVYVAGEEEDGVLEAYGIKVLTQ